MLKKNRILTLLAAAALVSACGGGGGGGDDPAPTNTGGDPTVSNPPATNPPATTPPATTPPAATPTATDQQLRGHLALVASQMVYLRTDRTTYHPVTLDQFEGPDGMFDAASGSTGPDSTSAVPPSATAPAAPLASFGFRIDKFVQPNQVDEAVGGQTAIGRIAFDFAERPNTAGVLANQVPESMRFIIDNVELSTDATGQLTGVRVLENARLHVEGRNAANVEVRETIPVNAGTVRLLPVSEVASNGGDTSSVVLLVDLENAFAQAGERLAAFNDLRGHFDMRVTLSSPALVRPAFDAPAPEEDVLRRDLVGAEIAVQGQPAVRGGGVSGSAWIRMLPAI